MDNMTPAVRRALRREQKCKTGVNYSKNIPEPPTTGLSIYQEIFDNLSAKIVNKRSPAHCPYPHNLCRGCRDAEICG